MKEIESDVGSPFLISLAMTRGVPKVKNTLWISRMRRGLNRKRMAVLIGHKGTSQLSRWEGGEELPSLRNALLLGYVLDRPVEELFAIVRNEVAEMVERRRKHDGEGGGVSDGQEA